jgi:hypothetical protein
MDHLDIILFSNQRRREQEVTKSYPKERDRKKEEGSRIGEVHDKFLLRKGIKILKTLIKQSLSIPETKKISITWLGYATFLVERDEFLIFKRPKGFYELFRKETSKKRST